MELINYLLIPALLLASIVLVGALLFRERKQYHTLQQRLSQAETELEEIRQQKDALFQLSQRFVDAGDEKDVIDLVLKLSLERVGAAGASYVPIDERGQPMAASSRGELPFPVVNDWVEYLASPSVRDRCNTCPQKATLTTSCPLLQGPFSEAIGMYCLPLSRGEKEFGVLNLYIPHADSLTPSGLDFLRTMLDETALALEGIRLRQRELEAFRQLQTVREKADLQSTLQGLLENTRQILEADYARLVLAFKKSKVATSNLEAGAIPLSATIFLDGILQGILVSGQPVILRDITLENETGSGVRSLLATPCLDEKGGVVGVLLVCNRKPKEYQPRQLVLLQTLTGQASQLVETAEHTADLEYRTMMDERKRLAREIHDGLAQTLGYLKLQVAQMINYLERGDLTRLGLSLKASSISLHEAYQDARQAIDGLRLWPAEMGLASWLAQTAHEIEEISSLVISIEKCDLSTSLPSEIQAQLIRIVQEALNNVRKHAQATQVVISCTEEWDEFNLVITDNGVGFFPENLTSPARHGLRGMQERAELIGADFQIVSLPNQGASVRLRLPLTNLTANKAKGYS
jgi:two-component system, NarL family, nitrate/nitrite sensor histidine kinase NarX